MLGRGIVKIPETLAAEKTSDRVADLFRVGWIYGVLPNLCVGAALLLVAAPAGAGDAVARTLIALVGAYFVVLGPALYWFATKRHPWLLLYVAFGAALLGTLLLSR